MSHSRYNSNVLRKIIISYNAENMPKASGFWSRIAKHWQVTASAKVTQEENRRKNTLVAQKKTENVWRPSTRWFLHGVKGTRWVRSWAEHQLSFRKNIMSGEGSPYYPILPQLRLCLLLIIPPMKKQVWKQKAKTRSSSIPLKAFIFFFIFLASDN